MKKPRLGIKVTSPSPTDSNCQNREDCWTFAEEEKEPDDDSQTLTEAVFTTVRLLK